MKRVLSLLLLLSAAPLAFAWGEKGHDIVNEAATVALPVDMPHFFYKAYPELIWLGYDPDRWKSGNFEALGAVNDPDHFLDYEYVEDLELPESRYEFIDLMYTSGRLRKLGIHNSEAGFVPWRIAELAQTLQVHFRNWRFSTPNTSERAAIERDIIHLAGILGHYVGDSANPHHATMNYNGWVSPNPNNYAIDCGTHSRFESNFVSHAVDVSNVHPKVPAKTTLHTDYFKAGLQSIKNSNALIETIYRIDRDGGFNPIGPPKKEGFEFATDRLAAGATLLRDLWWSAWQNSAKAPPRRGSSGD
jgi:hypothetical protein